MADNAPSLPQYSGFKGIPTPDQLGMNMNPYKAAGLLVKVGNAVRKPTKVGKVAVKGPVNHGRTGGGRASGRSGASRGSSGRSSGGGKK